MKRYILSSLLLLMAFLPAMAQVEIDTKTLLGTWSAKKDMATVGFTYKKAGKLDMRVEINAAQMQGSIVIKSQGTWRAEADSLVQTLDPESISVKYNGSNSAMGQQIEAAFSANKGKMMEQFGGGKGEFVLRNVIVADDLLIYTSQLPAPDGKAKEERVVMHRTGK